MNKRVDEAKNQTINNPAVKETLNRTGAGKPVQQLKEQGDKVQERIQESKKKTGKQITKQQDKLGEQRDSLQKQLEERRKQARKQAQKRLGAIKKETGKIQEQMEKERRNPLQRPINFLMQLQQLQTNLDSIAGYLQQFTQLGGANDDDDDDDGDNDDNDDDEEQPQQ